MHIKGKEHETAVKNNSAAVGLSSQLYRFPLLHNSCCINLVADFQNLQQKLVYPMRKSEFHSYFQFQKKTAPASGGFNPQSPKSWEGFLKSPGICHGEGYTRSSAQLQWHNLEQWGHKAIMQLKLLSCDINIALSVLWWMAALQTTQVGCKICI